MTMAHANPLTPALATLIAAWDRLGSDERRVLLLVATRLVTGRQAYGRLELATDTRDHRTEAGEELVDAVAYLAMRVLRGAP